MNNNPSIKMKASIRNATFKDYEDLERLKRIYNMDFMKEDVWRSLWENNPCYDAQWPIGWVLENSSSEVVGCFGNIPMCYEFKGRSLRVAAASTWIVDPKYRKSSLSLLYAYLKQKGVDLLLIATANEQATRVYEGLKLRKIPVADCDISFFWITNYLGFSRSLLNRNEIILSERLKYPLAFMLKILDFFKTKKIKNHSRQIDICEYSEFNEDFDKIWSNLESRKNQISAQRDSHSLKWHFDHSIKNDKVWIFGVKEQEELKSYAIFFRYDNIINSLKRFRLIDFQTVKNSSEDLLVLIDFALKKAEENKIDMIESVGFNGSSREVIKSYAPHNRKMPGWLFFYKALNEELAKQLNDPAVWNPTSFDGDGSLW